MGSSTSEIVYILPHGIVKYDIILQSAQEINILTEVSRKVESETMEYESFYKEQIRNNMQVEIEIRRILRDICNQQLLNEKLSQDLDRKSGEVMHFCWNRAYSYSLCYALESEVWNLFL